LTETFINILGRIQLEEGQACKVMQHGSCSEVIRFCLESGGQRLVAAGTFVCYGNSPCGIVVDPVALEKVLYAFWCVPVGTAYAMYF
jgi:hypothetical protein